MLEMTRVTTALGFHCHASLGEVAALLSPSHPPRERVGLHFGFARAALPQIRVETLIGSQANYEIKFKITIYFYNIMISYEKCSTLN